MQMKWIAKILTMFCVVLGLTVFGNAQNIYSVRFVDATHGFAAGSAGYFLRSVDAGATWTQVASGIALDLRTVSFSDTLNGWVCGNPTFGGGTVYRTTDGGASWKAQLGAPGWIGGISAQSATNVVMVGGGGFIMRTTDGGTTWGSVSSGTAVDLYNVTFVNANVGLAVGNYGVALRTTDGGATWAVQTTGVSRLYSGSLPTTVTGAGVGPAGAIVRTINGGSSWAIQTSPVGAAIFNGTAFADSNNGIIVGQSGIVLLTTNGGTTWTRPTSGTLYYLYDADFATTSIGVAVGSTKTIIRTTDGGATWSSGGSGGGGTAPSAPLLVSPSNGALGVTTSPTLTWNASSGATSYHLQVTAAPPLSATILDTNVTTTTCALSGLDNSATYYWQVNATNAYGTSPWSTTYNFTTVSSSPIFFVAPTSLGFGSVKLNVSKVMILNVKNTGGGSLVISSIASSSGIFVVSPTSATLAPGAATNVSVTFRPTAKVTYTANVTFTHNAAGSPVVVPVTGIGVKTTGKK